MSLVNQMLKDLEQRRASLPQGDSLRGLHAASAEAAPQRNPWPTLVIVAALSGVAYGWWMTFAQPGLQQQLSTTPLATTPVVATAPTWIATRTEEQSADAMDADWDKTWGPQTAAAISVAAVEEPPVNVAEHSDMAVTPPTPETTKPTAPKPLPSTLATAIAQAKPSSGTPSMRKTAHAANPVQQATQHYNDALAALRSGDTARSEELLRSVLDKVPGHLAASETLAAVLLQQQRVQDAENILINALAVTPTEPRLLKLHARILADAGRDNEAVALLQAPNFTNDAESQALLGALQQRLGNDVLAAGAYRQALLQAPQRGAWWLGLAISLERAQQPSDALAAYRRALSDRALGTQITTYVRERIAALDNGQG